MKIDERNTLNTEKSQSEKVYETRPETSSRTAKNLSPALQDGVALQGQDQLRALAMTPSAADASRIARLTQLVQSGQYQVDPVELSGAMVAAMLKVIEHGLDMTLKERCQAGETKLEQISNALLDPRPEILDHCEAELQEVVGMLSQLAEAPARPAVSDRGELLKLRHRTQLLAHQVQNAVNLCQGWTQMGMSQGYTDQGRPAVPASEPQASYEV